MILLPFLYISYIGKFRKTDVSLYSRPLTIEILANSTISGPIFREKILIYKNADLPSSPCKSRSP